MGWAALRRIGLAVALTSGLAGCAPVVEPDHLRLCRAVLPALHPEGATLREGRHAPVDGVRHAVRIDYVVEEPGRPRSTHYAVCRFAGGGTEAARFELAGLETERGPISDIRLMIIRRWWLGDAAIVAEQSARQQAAATAREVARPLAYFIQQVLNGLAPAALYGLLAAAYALVYGLVGRINFAFGEIAVAGAYATLGLAAGLATTWGVGPGLLAGLAAGLATAACLNLAVGRATVAPLSATRAGSQSVLIATIGLSVALSEALRLIHGSAARWAPPLASTPIALMRAGDFVVTVTLNQIGVVLLTLSLAAALVSVMRLSRFGRAWRAFADDPGAAQLFGIDPRRMMALTCLLSGALAGLAGAAHAVHFGSVHFAMGTAFVLKALIAAILGGVGSIGGAFIVGLVLGIAETLWSGYGPIAWRDTVVFAVLVALIVLRPAGLSGTDWRRA